MVAAQDAVAAMAELELLFKYLDAMGTLKVLEVGVFDTTVRSRVWLFGRGTSMCALVY